MARKRLNPKKHQATRPNEITSTQHRIEARSRRSPNNLALPSDESRPPSRLSSTSDVENSGLIENATPKASSSNVENVGKKETLILGSRSSQINNASMEKVHRTSSPTQLDSAIIDSECCSSSKRDNTDVHIRQIIEEFGNVSLGEQDRAKAMADINYMIGSSCSFLQRYTIRQKLHSCGLLNVLVALAEKNISSKCIESEVEIYLESEKRDMRMLGSTNDNRVPIDIVAKLMADRRNEVEWTKMTDFLEFLSNHNDVLEYVEKCQKQVVCVDSGVQTEEEQKQKLTRPVHRRGPMLKLNNFHDIPEETCFDDSSASDEDRKADSSDPSSPDAIENEQNLKKWATAIDLHSESQSMAKMFRRLASASPISSDCDEDFIIPNTNDTLPNLESTQKSINTETDVSTCVDVSLPSSADSMCIETAKDLEAPLMDMDFSEIMSVSFEVVLPESSSSSIAPMAKNVPPPPPLPMQNGMSGIAPMGTNIPPPPPPMTAGIPSLSSRKDIAPMSTNVPPPPPPPPPSLAGGIAPISKNIPPPPPPPPGIAQMSQNTPNALTIPQISRSAPPPPPLPSKNGMAPMGSNVPPPPPPPPPPAMLKGAMSAPPPPPPPPPPFLMNGKTPTTYSPGTSTSPILSPGIVKSAVTYRKQKKTCLVRWQKLNPMQMQGAGTVFNDTLCVDFNEEERSKMEEVFEETPMKKPVRTVGGSVGRAFGSKMMSSAIASTSDTNTLTGRSPTNAQVLCSPKALTIEILLKKLKPLSFTELITKLESNDIEGIKIDLMGTLHANFPEAEELAPFEHVELRNLSHASDQFCWHIAKKPTLKLRIELLITKENVVAEITKFQSQIELLLSACQLARGTSIQMLLRKCLQYGNYLNQGSMFAEAAGFSLSYLLTLLQLKGKGSHSSVRLVDLLVNFCDLSTTEIEEIQTKMTSVRSLALKDLIQAVEQIERTIKKLDSAMKNSNDEALITAYEPFIQKTSDQLANVRNGSEDLKAREEELRVYLCAGDMSLQGIFDILEQAMKVLMDAIKQAANKARVQRATSMLTLPSVSSSQRSLREGEGLSRRSLALKSRDLPVEELKKLFSHASNGLQRTRRPNVASPLSTTRESDSSTRTVRRRSGENSRQSIVEDSFVNTPTNKIALEDLTSFIGSPV